MKFSISGKLKQAGVQVKFGTEIVIETKNGTEFNIGEIENLFVWRMNECHDVSAGECETNEIEEIALSSKLSMWHRRLGHKNWNNLSKLCEHVDGKSVSVDDSELCNCYELNKQNRRAIPKDCGTRAEDILEYRQRTF